MSIIKSSLVSAAIDLMEALKLVVEKPIFSSVVTLIQFSAEDLLFIPIQQQHGSLAFIIDPDLCSIRIANPNNSDSPIFSRRVSILETIGNDNLTEAYVFFHVMEADKPVYEWNAYYKGLGISDIALHACEYLMIDEKPLHASRGKKLVRIRKKKAK